MKPLPPNEWDPSLQHVIDDMNGRPIHMHCLLANHPDLLSAWWTYRMHSVQGGDLEQRDCELVILRSGIVNSSYCASPFIWRPGMSGQRMLIAA